MTSQTRARVGLLLGLIFIIAFGIILSELQPPSDSDNPEFPPHMSDVSNVVPEPEFIPADRFYTPRQPSPVVTVPRDENVDFKSTPQPPEPREVARSTPEPVRPVLIRGTIERNRDEPYFEQPGRTREVPIEQLPTVLADESQRRQPRPVSRQRVYVVKSGDNLTRIAKKMLGDGSAENVNKLFNANRNRMANKNTLSVGTKLIIPG